MIHTLHRLSACLIGSFITIHLLNHLLALGSIDAHISFMKSFRQLYRIPVIEALLLSGILFQVGSGLQLIKNRWGERRGFYARLQAISGGYLAFFLINHIAAVLFGRTLLGLDTNFYFAAAGLHISPFQLFFVPYYYLAVLAIFAHVACALHWLSRERFTLEKRNRLGFLIIAIGALLSLLITLAMAGVFYPMEIPTQYAGFYGKQS
ncbi:hypothetical protein [Pseudomonas anguilliseptica]|uniref:hypothetical protein n=1 Tax=Pseudomonas anguilliseptica TaxID=53406 RepID=UPI003734C27B